MVSWCKVLYSVCHETWSRWSRGARCCTQYATRLGADGLVVHGIVLLTVPSVPVLYKMFIFLDKHIVQYRTVYSTKYH